VLIEVYLHGELWCTHSVTFGLEGHKRNPRNLGANAAPSEQLETES
jgi:hypothetical protein